MFRNYFKIAYRNLWKHKYYAALNIFGLSLGIAGGIVLFLFISYHLSFDMYHKNAGQLYRVVTDLHLDDGSVEYEQGTPLALTRALQNDLSEIKDHAVLLKVRSMSVNVPLSGQTKLFKEHENIAFADPHWFNLFDYSWMQGNAATSLREPNTAVITRRLAEKYFGSEEAVGKTILLDDTHPVMITGILKNYPDNTDTRVDLFLSRASFNSFYPHLEEKMNNDWQFINATTHSFLLLPDNVPKKKIDAALANVTKKHLPKDLVSAYHFRLQALKDIHFDGRYSGVIRKSLLISLGGVGLFLVIIACFNFINLATAQSSKRSKEIGTRKVLGGTPASIFSQFMTETACMVLIATALSLFWIKLILPVLNDWLQIKLGFNPLQDQGLLVLLVALMGFVVLGSGFYPAFILSRFKPILALKKQTAVAQPAGYRKVLIVIQNVIVQLLIICTVVITLQIKHLKTADLGFSKEEVLMIPIPDSDKDKHSYLEHQLRMNPEIKSLSFCFQAPMSEANMGGSVKFDDRPWEKFAVRSVIGDADYMNTFGLQLIAGRNLEESDTIRQFLVNETLVRKLNIKDPEQIIGYPLIAGGFEDHPGTIAGVVKDFNVHALYTGIEPVILTTKRDLYQHVAIKKRNGNPARTLQTIQNTWQAVYPGKVFEYHYLDEQIDQFYHKEALVNKLINATTTIAIVISCLGLLGLISFFAVQRSKEIGIRKVLGASVTSIVYLLFKEFFSLLLFSIVVASPIAWYFMSNWLQDFAYRINFSWWIFVVAGMASIFIAFLTVCFQSAKAAFANPVEGLRAD